MPHTLPRLQAPTKTWQQVVAEARLEALDAEQASGDAGVAPRGSAGLSTEVLRDGQATYQQSMAAGSG